MSKDMSKDISKDMSPEAAIQLFDDTLNTVPTTLSDLADSLQNDEELANKILSLAAQTSPKIIGMDEGQRKALPQVMLRQNSSNSQRVPEDCKPGQLYTSTGDLIGDTLSFIPLYMNRIRRKWADDKIECQSLDGKTGSVYGDCKSCPYGQFTPGVRPECSPGTNYVIVAEDLSAIYRIEFIKSSAPAGKIIQQLARPPYLWSRAFTLASEKQQGQKNATYFTMKVTPQSKRTPENVSKICHILYEFASAQHKRYVLQQEEYRKSRGTGGGTSAGDAGAIDTIAESTDEINFNEAM
jgi:hypothetical protein